MSIKDELDKQVLEENIHLKNELSKISAQLELFTQDVRSFVDIWKNEYFAVLSELKTTKDVPHIWIAQGELKSLEKVLSYEHNLKERKKRIELSLAENPYKSDL